MPSQPSLGDQIAQLEQEVKKISKQVLALKRRAFQQGEVYQSAKDRRVSAAIKNKIVQST